MRIAICEDEKKYTEWLAKLIKEWSEDRNVPVEIFTHITAEKFLYEWADSEDYDILFLDIHMGTLTGIELAKQIRKTNNYVTIVFTTNHSEYATQGYYVDAIRYLMKPVKKKDCFDCLDRVHQSDITQKYFISKDLETDKTFKIPHRDIICIEMSSHDANIVTTKDEYTFRKTTAQLLEELNDDLFVRCHKSYIINIRHVESFSKSFAFMSNDNKIPISKNMAEVINEKFRNYNINKV